MAALDAGHSAASLTPKDVPPPTPGPASLVTPFVKEGALGVMILLPLLFDDHHETEPHLICRPGMWLTHMPRILLAGRMELRICLGRAHGEGSHVLQVM